MENPNDMNLEKWQIDIYYSSNHPLKDNLIIGKVSSSLRKNLNIVLVVNETFMRQHCERIATVKYQHNGCGVILTRDAALQLLKGDQTIKYIIWHEIGHIANGDYKQDKKSESNMGERFKNVMVGKVSPEELAADLFAAKNTSKDVALNALECSKKKRIFDDTLAHHENDSISKLAIQEYCMRIQAIKDAKI